MWSNEIPIYEKYVNEIVRSFAKEMEEEFPLRCIGSGGQMPYNVEEIAVLFVSHQKSSIEQARMIEVKGIQKLLSIINNHKEIRPYLNSYPFTIDQIHVSLSFTNAKGAWRTDGSVAHVFFTKHKIFYDTAKIKIIPPVPIENFPEDEEIPEWAKKERTSQTLVSLMEETYEEAVTALENQEKKQNQKPL